MPIRWGVLVNLQFRIRNFTTHIMENFTVNLTAIFHPRGWYLHDGSTRVTHALPVVFSCRFRVPVVHACRGGCAAYASALSDPVMQCGANLGDSHKQTNKHADTDTQRLSTEARRADATRSGGVSRSRHSCWELERERERERT